MPSSFNNIRLLLFFFSTSFITETLGSFCVQQQQSSSSFSAISKPCSQTSFRRNMNRLPQFPKRRTTIPSYTSTSTSTSTSLSITSLPSLTLPLISPQNNWANIATLSATATLSQTLGKTTTIGKLLGPPVTAMALAFLLGSIGILPPGGSDGAKLLQSFALQLATPLLLLGVNVRECRERSGPLLVAFLVAAAGTVLASVVAVGVLPVVPRLLERSLGLDGLKIAAALMAKNVGGGINYIAVCKSLNASPNAVAAGLCVDNIFALLYFPITSAIASGRPDVIPPSKSQTQPQIKEEEETDQSTINTETVSAALTIAATATWLGEALGKRQFSLPVATFLTLLFATIFPSRCRSLRETGEVLGTSLLYLFFATAGAPGLSIADSVRSSFVPIALFLFVLYAIHGIVLVLTRSLVVSWRMRRGSKWDHDLESESDEGAFAPQRLLVASSASIGGPATAAALAKANGWTSLVGPSLVVGNLGYAIATFAGIAFHAIFTKR